MSGRTEAVGLMAIAVAISAVLMVAGAPLWAAVLATIATFLVADLYHFYSQAPGGHDDGRK